jgi:hypothetical protein
MIDRLFSTTIDGRLCRDEKTWWIWVDYPPLDLVPGPIGCFGAAVLFIFGRLRCAVVSEVPAAACKSSDQRAAD